MMNRMMMALLGATALGATAALAQTTAPSTPPTTPSTPSTTAPLTNADVSDADVAQFATAVLAVQKIQKDPTIAAADKQKQMADAVKQAGMTPEKYNAIATASQADAALMKRIEVAAAAKMQAAPAGTSGSTTPSDSTSG